MFFLYCFDMFDMLDKSAFESWKKNESHVTFFRLTCFIIFNMWWIEMLSELILKNNTGNMKEGFIMFIITWMQLCVKMIINADLKYAECWLLWFFFLTMICKK